MTARALRSRATDALAVAPVTVTDRSAPAVLGLEPRAFRELVARERIAHARAGRRIIVRVDAVLAVLDRLAANGADAAPVAAVLPDDAHADAELANVDAVLARIGRRRTG